MGWDGRRRKEGLKGKKSILVWRETIVLQFSLLGDSSTVPYGRAPEEDKAGQASAVVHDAGAHVMDPHTTWQWVEGMIKAGIQPHPKGTSSCEHCPGMMGQLLQETPWLGLAMLATSFISEES